VSQSPVDVSVPEDSQTVKLLEEGTELITWAQEWFIETFFSYSTLLQVGLLIGAFLLGLVLRKPLREPLQEITSRNAGRWFTPLLEGLRDLLFPFGLLIFIALFTVIALQELETVRILSVSLTLTLVWIVIRFLSSFVRNRTLARWMALGVWIVAALDITGLLGVTTERLDSLAFTLSDSRISVLIVLKALLIFAIVLWMANAFSSLAESRIQNVTSLTPSLRVLLTKATRGFLLIIAFLVVLNTLGIDLTSLAVFSGAVGVGLGFGLQKVVSNFISGIILLLDRSIKPGDVIYISDTDTYGWVNSLGARCVSVITRDGKEHLIPNELLITEKVENWSYSNRDVRIKIAVGIAYSSDPHKAIEIMKQVAHDNPRVLQSPRCIALVTGFGDSSVDLELRCWINDPSNGIGNITSELLLEIWDRFHEQGIEFPFPQRDVHIKPDSTLKILQ
jgi:small-conductance mechanosensitive channel